MTEVVRFALLGLGAAGVYALLAQGIVLISNGSGVINFAQGAMAVVGAAAYHEAQASGAAVGVALFFSAAAGASVALAFHFAVMRPLRDAAPLTRMIAT